MENLKPGSIDLYQYTHLIVEGKSKFSNSLKPYAVTHEVIDTIEAFHQLSFNYLTIPPIKIKTKPVLFILRRRDNYKEFLHIVGGKEKTQIDFKQEERAEYAPGDFEQDGTKDTDRSEEESLEEPQHKTETSTEKNEAISDTTIDHIQEEENSSENFDVDKKTYQGNNKKMQSMKPSTHKTENEIVKAENAKTDKASSEADDEELDSVRDAIVPNFNKKLSDSGENLVEKLTVEDEKPVISEKITFVEGIKAYNLENVDKTVDDFRRDTTKRTVKKTKVFSKLPTASDKHTEKEHFGDSGEVDEDTTLKRKKINFEKSVKAEAEKILKSKYAEKLKPAKDTGSNRDKDENEYVKKYAKKVIKANEDKEILLSTPKPSIEEVQNRLNVKQTIKKIIQKYKKEKFDKEYYSQPKEFHTKENIKRIIDKEKLNEEKKEIAKLEQQIMDLIENNEKIVNKDLIKNKIQETIRTELLNALDDGSLVPQEDLKKVEAKEPKRKFDKPKVIIFKKASDNEQERELVLPIIKETIKTAIEPSIPDDLDDLSISDEDYATGEQGVPLDSEESSETGTGKSIEKDVLESEKIEFVKKFKKANEKLENIMTIIEEIVDTIEITDDEDPVYLV